MTTGLVHHYFASRDALVAATLDSMAVEIAAAARSTSEVTSDPGETVWAVWRLMQIRPAFTFIAAWWLLEGRNVTEAMGDHPFARTLAMALGRPTMTPSPTQG